MNFAYLSYFTIFSPLIATIVCYFTNFKKKNLEILSKVISFLILSLLILIFAKIYKYGPIHLEIFNKINFLPSKFTLNLADCFFMILVSFFAIFFIYFHQFEFAKKLNKNSQKLFYCSFFVNLFSIFSICATINIFEIFLFSEILFLSSFALFSVSNNKISLNNISKNLTAHIATAFILIFCIFVIYFKFQTLEIVKLQIILTKPYNSNFAKALLFLLIPALFIKFFNISQIFISLKSEDKLGNFTIAKNIFVDINLGIFIFLKLGLIFSQEISIALLLSLVLFVAVIFYYLRAAFSRHILQAIINIAFVLFAFSLIIFQVNPVFYLKYTIFYLIFANLISFVFVIFGFILKRNFNSSNFDRISDLTAIDSKIIEFLLILLKISIILLIFAPPLLSFVVNFNLIKDIYFATEIYSLEYLAFLKPILFLLIFLIQSLLFIFAIKIILKIFYPDKISNFEFEEPELKQYLIYFSAMLLPIVIYLLLSLNYEIYYQLIIKISESILTK